MTRRYPEHDFQAAAHVFLSRALPDALHWATDHAGARSPAAGARLKRRGIIPGIPDHFTFRWGTLIAWEWKAGANTTSSSQDAFGAAIKRHAGHYVVCYRIEEIEAFLLSLGWPLKATAGGIDAKLAERISAPKKPARPRADRPSVSSITRMEKLRKRTPF